MSRVSALLALGTRGTGVAKAVDQQFEEPRHIDLADEHEIPVSGAPGSRPAHRLGGHVLRVRRPNSGRSSA